MTGIVSRRYTAGAHELAELAAATAGQIVGIQAAISEGGTAQLSIGADVFTVPVGGLMLGCTDFYRGCPSTLIVAGATVVVTWRVRRSA